MSIFNNKTEKQHRSIEDLYFEDIEEGVDVKIFLTSGIRLTGTVLGHDNATVLLHTNKHGETLIYKGSISAIKEDRNDK